MKLLVLDGNSLVNRAYFGIKLLTTKDGRYTNAIFGFQNILLNLLSAHHPDAVAIAWDEKAPTFRHTAYDGYKATRHGMPQELAEQMPVLKQLLTDLGFVQVSKPGWEADDILGTLAAANEAAGGTTLLATGDRDSLQLVDDATTVLLATNRETLPMDPAAIQEKYGVAPPQLIEVKSLMGDASDNIPGVPGIGEKTALALVQKFGSLQGVYEHLDDKAIKPKQREKLEANKELAELSHMLGTIRKDAPIETAPEHYCRTAGDPATAAQLLAELEMHKLTARWGLDESPAAVAASAETLPEVQPDLLPLAPEGRYDLAQNKDGSWYAVQGDSVYLLDNDRLPSLLEQLAENPLKFIIFIDDLSFAGNDEHFAALKATLEGSVTACAKNTVIYATSNRRHLVKETMEERSGDDIHLNDTLQELMSLSARFGMTITFQKPDKDGYLAIVKHLAKEYGLEMSEEGLCTKAESFAIRQNGRSPRTAKHFVETQLAKL